MMLFPFGNGGFLVESSLRLEFPGMQELYFSPKTKGSGVNIWPKGVDEFLWDNKRECIPESKVLKVETLAF